MTQYVVKKNRVLSVTWSMRYYYIPDLPEATFVADFTKLLSFFQTKIYEADYKIEHKDHERMLQENKRLRRREGEMRQQMALLQEQVSYAAT